MNASIDRTQAVYISLLSVLVGMVVYWLRGCGLAVTGLAELCSQGITSPGVAATTKLLYTLYTAQSTPRPAHPRPRGGAGAGRGEQGDPAAPCWPWLWLWLCGCEAGCVGTVYRWRCGAAGGAAADWFSSETAAAGSGSECRAGAHSPPPGPAQ